MGINVAPERWTIDVLRRLGQEPDAAIARDLGVSRERVRQIRNEMRVKSCVFDPFPDEAFQLLGTMPDWKLAEQFGISAARVAIKRGQNGIPPFRRAPKVHVNASIPPEYHKFLLEIGNGSFTRGLELTTRILMRLTEESRP